MKTEQFVAGQIWVERKTNREGPPISYIALKGFSSMSFVDKKALLKFIHWPKGTPTGDSLRDWLDTFNDEPELHAANLDMDRISKEGFGPEAHDDDPTVNTKMVT